MLHTYQFGRIEILCFVLSFALGMIKDLDNNHGKKLKICKSVMIKLIECFKLVTYLLGCVQD